MNKILVFILLFCSSAFADTLSSYSAILSAATTTGAGSAFGIPKETKSFQCSGTTSASTGASAIKIQGSNDATIWTDLATVSLTLGTTSTNDGFVTTSSYVSYRANVSSISGTGATVACSMGY